MTDLRKAAEMVLESWDFFFSQAHPEVVGLMYGSDWAKIAKERTEALRQALAQPEWVGLTDEELLIAYGWIPAPGAPDWILNGAKEELLGALRKVEAKLKEKNT